MKDTLLLNFIQKSSGGIKKLLVFIFLSTFLFSYDVTLQLKWKHAFQFAGFYMAKEKGFYKKYGLNVKFREFNGSNIVNEVLKGSSEFGISDFSLVKDRLEGKKVVAIMPIFKYTPLAIVSINPKIKNLKHLKSVSICSPKYYLNSLAFYLFLMHNKINKEDLEIKEQYFNLNSIKNRKCDLYVIYETDQLYYFKKLNIPYKVFSFKEVPLYGDILFTSEEFRYSHPSIIENFKKASIEGWKYAINHIDETIKVIMKKYNTQHFSYDKLLNEAKLTKLYLSNFKFDIKKINELKLLSKLAFRLNSDFDLVDFIYSPYIKTKKEADFIKNHIFKTINTYTWPPFIFKQHHQLVGISKDFFDIIKNALFLKTQNLVAKNFSEVLEAIKTKKADISFAAMITKNRNYALFSKPYSIYHIAIATKRDLGYIPDMKFLFGKKVAIGKDYTSYELIKENYPQIKIVEVTNTKEALRYLEKGEVDAVIDILPVLAYYISKLRLYDVKVNGITSFRFKLSFMLNKDNKILLTLINRVIDEMDEKRKFSILQKYVLVDVQKGYSKSYLYKKYLLFSFVILFLVLVIGVLIYQYLKIRKLKKILEQMAYYDKLTNIYNRRKISNILTEFFNYSKRYKVPLSLIYFDIDFFKKVNDIYGHKKGDFVLKELAKIIKSNIRESDVFGRWGGEEFLILLPNTDINGAKKVAEKLREVVKSYDFEGMNITISLGVTELKEDDTIEEFINRADMALYNAKRRGRDRVEIL